MRLRSHDEPLRALVRAAVARWKTNDPEGMTAVAAKLRELALLDSSLATAADYVEGLAATYRGEPEQGTALLERAAAAMAVDSHNWPHIVQKQAALGWLGRTTEGHAVGERRGARTPLRRRPRHAAGSCSPLPPPRTWTTTDGPRLRPKPPRPSKCARSSASRRTRPSSTPSWPRWRPSVATRRRVGLNIKMASEVADRHGRPWEQLIASRAGGLLALGQSDLAAARSAFTEVANVPLARGLRGPTVISIPDLAEVLVRTGQLKEAALRTEELERRTRGMTDIRAPALVLRCRALTASGAKAQELFQAAIKAHSGDPDEFVSARTHLLYGEWLRRQGERRAARAELAEALATFDNYGAVPWSGRARGELRASGMTLRSRPQAHSSLTPAELRVALLAADGLSTKEICAQLYLSTNTVEFHLGRVYRKLGVRGRTELARRLPGRHEVPLTKSDDGPGELVEA